MRDSTKVDINTSIRIQKKQLLESEMYIDCELKNQNIYCIHKSFSSNEISNQQTRKKDDRQIVYALLS